MTSAGDVLLALRDRVFDLAFQIIDEHFGVLRFPENGLEAEAELFRIEDLRFGLERIREASAEPEPDFTEQAP